MILYFKWRKRRDSKLTASVHLVAKVFASSTLGSQGFRISHIMSPGHCSLPQFFTALKTAEAERFELSIPCGMPPFQGGGINHYPTLPTRDL